MFRFFNSLKRAMSGEEIATIDTEIMGGACVLVAAAEAERVIAKIRCARPGWLSGSYQYHRMDADG